MYNWFINQEIVCIKTHSDRKVKEGDVVIIKAIKKYECHKCHNGLVFDIGIKSNMRSIDGRVIPLGAMVECNNEHGIPYIADGIYWLSETLFKPLDELADISELTEIINKPVELLFNL